MNFREKITGRDIAGFLLLGLSLIMLGKSLMLCFSNDIWYDELFTVGMVEHSYGELVRFTAADVHPPLYYCMVKLFVDLCKLIMPGAGTVIPAKIVSVLPYFILMLYAVTFMRKRFGLFVGGLFLFCVTAMPQLPAYTVEVRMYGWAMLFVTGAFLHAGELVQSYVNYEAKPSNRANAAAAVEVAAGQQTKTHSLHGAALVLYGLAAAYTQYFACVAVVMVYLFVLFAFWLHDRRRMKEWLFYVAVSVVGYVPWLFALAGQLSAVSENYWILPLTWRSLGGCVKFLMKPTFANETVNTVLAVILFAAYLGLWCRWMSKLYYNRREMQKNLKIAQSIEEKEKSIEGKESSKKYVGGERREGRTTFCCAGIDGTEARFALATAGAGVLAGLVAFGFAASFLIRPVFVYRYMIPALGCFWLGFALCLDELLCKPRAMPCAETCGDAIKKKLCKLNAIQHMEKKQFTEKMQYADENDNTGRHNIIGRNRIWQAAGIVLMILIVIVGLRDYRAFMGEEEYKVRLMAETKDALAMIGPRDSVIYNFDQVQAVTGYYLPETAERYLWRVEGEKLIQEITSPCGMVEDVREIQEMLENTRERGKDEEENRNVWFIGSFNSREEIVAEWRGAGLEVEEKGSFLLERYWFNLYKIS